MKVSAGERERERENNAILLCVRMLAHRVIQMVGNDTKIFLILLKNIKIICCSNILSYKYLLNTK